MQFQSAVKGWAAGNWFLLALPFLFLASFMLAATSDWARDVRTLEAVIVFDWCVAVPTLYALCYRGRVPLRHLLLRLLALACLGVWVAAQLVPAASQTFLAELGPARAIGLAVLVLIELRLIAAVIGLAFSGAATAEQIAEKSGAPPFLARLLLLEARFWRAVWRLIRGR
jgi:hypothetical protein